MSYINFHCHSVYSKKDAISEPIDIAKINKEYGNDAFCITDHGDLGAWIQGYEAAKKLNMQFIPGCEFYMLPDRPEFWTKNVKEEDIETENVTRKYFHFLAFAKNQKGVESLVALYNTHEDHYGRPCITKESLFNNSDGLIVTNACVSGEILFYLANGYDDLAEKSILELKEHFKDDFYVELQYHNLTFIDEVSVYNKLVGLAKKHNIKMIPTTDSHFNKKDDVIAHNIYKDIYKERYQYDFSKNEFDKAFDGEGYYIKNEQEIRESIKNITALTSEDIDEIINNTAEIREKCEPTNFPKAIEFKNCEDRLWELVLDGWERKRKGTDLEKESRERIDEEMSTICEMGFTEYFINMYNIIKRAKMLNIVTGAARGCFLPDNVVITEGVDKHIQDVEVGDMVLTRSGNYRPVVGLHEYDVDEECIELELSNGKTIRCTLDHEILVDGEWVRADEIAVGAKLFNPRTDNEQKPYISTQEEACFRRMAKND